MEERKPEPLIGMVSICILNDGKWEPTLASQRGHGDYYYAAEDILLNEGKFCCFTKEGWIPINGLKGEIISDD